MMRIDRAIQDMNARMARYLGVSLDELLSSPPIPPSPPMCDTCGDLGVVSPDVRRDHPLWGKLIPCPAGCPAVQQQRAAKSARLLTRSGLPAKYTALTFETWYAQDSAALAGKQIAAAAAWSAVGGGLYSLSDAAALVGLSGSYSSDPRGWLVLQGPMGTGKTGLAASIVNERAARGLDSLFYRAADLFADVQGRYGKQDDGGSADDLLDQVKRAALLVLDELNVPQPSADKQRIIEEVIRYRHGRDLPTVITCNVGVEDFTKMWGGRASDVVLEAAHWIVVGGLKIRRSTSAIVGE